MRETIITATIVTLTMLCIAVMITIIRWLNTSGILKRILEWFKTSETGRTIKRIIKVITFIIVIVVLGYFIFTGFQI